MKTLRIEWMKLKNYRTFWVLLAMTIVGSPAFNYSIYDLMDNSFPKIKGKSIIGSPFAFPDVWQTVTWNSSMLFIIPAILVITLTCNEFTYRTHRQNIIDGWKRSQFVAVKIFEVFLLSLLMTLVVFLTVLYFGRFANKIPEGVDPWQNIRFIYFYFVEMISYTMIAFLISMFIKRAGLSMGIFFVYMVMEQFAVGLLGSRYNKLWVAYFPEEVTDRLIPQPYAQKLLSNKEAILRWENHIPLYLMIALLYLTTYILVTTLRFKKADL